MIAEGDRLLSGRVSATETCARVRESSQVATVGSQNMALGHVHNKAKELSRLIRMAA